jgi:hypothetical protein
MKKRVDEIQTFSNSARVANTGTTRILTPPQHNNSSPNATQSQYQILNVLQRGDSTTTGSNAGPIQYTYASTAVTATNVPKNNLNTQQNSQSQSQTVQVISTGSVNVQNPVRPKPIANSGNITPTPLTVTSPGGNTVPAQSVSGQNFPRLKVEDALSYLDQVS